VWHVVIPVKSWATAKSRLAVPAPDRERLAQAMAQDTVAAVSASRLVSAVTVVVGDRRQAASRALRTADEVVVQPDPAWDVNQALHWAAQHLTAQHLTAQHPTGEAAFVAVVLGDLPALRPGALDELLTAAAHSEHGVFAPDRHDRGTTALALAHGPLETAFGRDSAGRHREAGLSEAEALPPVLRCDVDTLDDLQIALALGVGPCTATAVAEMADSLPWPP
jgi:2-phospho-L-lactate guanylyltransferase